MQNSVKLKLHLLVALWSCITAVSGQVTQSALVDKVWDAIGGQENWRDARYFMFSSTGGRHSFAEGERRYLWDKQTGDCRFDGMTTDDEAITVLFNIKTTEGRVYINNTELANPRTTADIIAEITEEFNQDAHLLFLPTIMEGDQVSYTIAGEKLIGAQRFTVVDIENKKTSFEAAIAGQLYIDSQSGKIQQWRPNHAGSQFSVGGYKDIGGGLVLPTRFTSNDTTASITYPLAATLVYIEGDKFSKP